MIVKGYCPSAVWGALEQLGIPAVKPTKTLGVEFWSKWRSVVFCCVATPSGHHAELQVIERCSLIMLRGAVPGGA